MITYSKLGYNGRLGNQLFQIASTIGISIKNNEEYLFPEFSYNKYLKNHIPVGDLKFNSIYEELNFHYDDVNIKNCDLHGYFQSEEYFKHCESIIRYHFSLNDKDKDYLKSKYKYLLDSPNCSIHIRRGDYLTKQDYHVNQPISYYEKAIDIIGHDKNYLIFSDDIQWCKQAFSGDNFYYIEEIDILELFLMSYCDNNIIANSSFSWWAAWLNENIEKEIISPINWFGNKIPINTKNLIPEKWKTI